MTTKHKRLQKTKDFQKQKLKVGKKKQLAPSHTETAFKSQSIHIPTQNIRTASSASPLVDPRTSRHLSIHDLLSHINHPSASMRKDGVCGILELLEAHQHVATFYISSLCTIPIKLLLDSDHHVRKATVSMYTRLFSILDSDTQISPFFSIIMAYTCSALTHIAEYIRVDALLFLHLLIEKYPSLATLHGSSRIIPAFIQQLSGSSSSLKSGAVSGLSALNVAPTSKFGSVNVRLDLLSNLKLFIEAVVDPITSDHVMHNHDGVNVVVIDEDVLLSANAHSYPLKSSLGLCSHPKQAFMTCPISFSTTSPFSEFNSSSTNMVDLYAVFKQFYPVAFDLWIEYLPNVIHADSISTNTESNVLSTILYLFSLLLNSSDTWIENSNDDIIKNKESFWKLFSKHILPHFPFGSDTLTNVKPSKSKFDVALDLNLYFCSILSSFTYFEIKRTSYDTLKLTRGFLYNLFTSPHAKTYADTLNDTHLETMFMIMANMLHMKGRNVEEKIDSDLFISLLSFICSTRYTSNARKRGFFFIYNFVNSLIGFSGSFNISQSNVLLDANIKEGIRKWMMSLPRTLCENALDHPGYSSDFFSAMLMCLRAMHLLEMKREDLDMLMRMLVPIKRLKLKDGKTLFESFGIEEQLKFSSLIHQLDNTIKDTQNRSL